MPQFDLRRILSVGVLLFALPLAAQSPSSSLRTEAVEGNRYHRYSAIEGRAFLGAENYSDLFNEARLVHFRLDARGETRLSDRVTFSAAGGLSINGGQVQGLAFDNERLNGVFLYEAALTARGPWGLALRAGALSQNTLNAPLLIWDQTFPAIEILWQSGTLPRGQWTARAQEAIPTSTSLSTRTIEKEEIPRFTSQSLSWERRFLSSGLDVRADIARYAYERLPMVAALRSETYGNSVVPLGLNSARFIFEFEGVHAGFRMRQRLARGFHAGARAVGLDNLKADAGRDRGQLLGLEVGQELSSRWSWEFNPAYFINQSDSAPAFYTWNKLGRNNREGVLLEARLHSAHHGLTLTAQYVNSQLIENRPNQSPLEVLWLGLETDYESWF